MRLTDGALIGVSELTARNAHALTAFLHPREAFVSLDL